MIDMFYTTVEVFLEQALPELPFEGPASADYCPGATNLRSVQ